MQTNRCQFLQTTSVGSAAMSGLLPGYVVRADEAMFPPYEDLGDTAAAVFDALAKETPEYRRSGWGGLIHITNHAAGLAELSRFGYPELATKGRQSNVRTVPVSCRRHVSYDLKQRRF